MTAHPQNHEQLAHPKYRADIDGLRAVAILSVVGYHAFPLSVQGGFIGVDIFFVISGFLISTIIFESLSRNSFSFIEFYSRRIRRIFPALILVLTSSFIFGWYALLSLEYRQLGKHIVGGAGFISNFLFWGESGYFDNAADTKPLLHLWSLGIEEQFYVIWPLLAWLAWRKKINLLAIIIAIATISFSLNIGKINGDAVAAFYSPLTRFWELMIGSILAHLTLHEQTRLIQFNLRLSIWLSGISIIQPTRNKAKLFKNVQSLSGALLILFGITFINNKSHFPGWWALIPTLGATLIISAGGQAWLNRKILSHPVLVWFGLISFPFYLWHWPLLSFTHILEGEIPKTWIRIIAVILSIALAWLSYKLIEKPIRVGKHGKQTTILLIILMSGIALAGYITYKREGLKFRAVVIKNADIYPNIPAQSNQPSQCSNEKKYALVNKFCTKYIADNAQKTIVLWGDSSTGAWQTVFLDVAKLKNYTLIVISHENCSPLLDVNTIQSNKKSPEKLPYCTYGVIQAQALELIKASSPDLTVVIAGWNWLNPNCNTDQKLYPERSNRPLENRIRETIQELEKISKLVVFRSWPLLATEPNYQMLRIPFLQSKTSETIVTTSDFNKDNACINDIFDSINTSNTLFFSPSKKICSEKCVSVLNGTRMFVDAYHITPLGSMKFKDEVEKLLE